MSQKQGRVRVYIAASLDGYIAGKGGDLSWLPGATPESIGPLPGPEADASTVGYGDFTANVGAMLMGRTTFETVLGFGGPFPYGDMPLLVATHRPLAPPAPSVRGVTGSIEELVGKALTAAEGKDVYIDGGNLIQQALDADLIDEMIVSVVPVLLGAGHSLFDGIGRRVDLEFTHVGHLGMGMIQYGVRRRGT